MAPVVTAKIAESGTRRWWRRVSVQCVTPGGAGRGSCSDPGRRRACRRSELRGIERLQAPAPWSRTRRRGSPRRSGWLLVPVIATEVAAHAPAGGGAILLQASPRIARKEEPGCSVPGVAREPARRAPMFKLPDARGESSRRLGTTGATCDDLLRPVGRPRPRSSLWVYLSEATMRAVLKRSAAGSSRPCGPRSPRRARQQSRRP